MVIKNLKAIVFDFGNVIIDIDFNNLFEGFSRTSGKSIEAIKKRFEEYQLFRRYETGVFTDDEFMEVIRQAIGFPYNDKEIQVIWNSLLLNIPNQRIELINDLKLKYPVYLLSNTNSIHINACNLIFKDKLGLNSLHDYFTKAYLSYEIGMWKPDEDIYQYVIKDLNCKPQEILFLDDNYSNVESAKRLGINTVHITKEYGILEYFKENNY